MTHSINFLFTCVRFMSNLQLSQSSLCIFKSSVILSCIPKTFPRPLSVHCDSCPLLLMDSTLLPWLLTSRAALGSQVPMWSLVICIVFILVLSCFILSLGAFRAFVVFSALKFHTISWQRSISLQFSGPFDLEPPGLPLWDISGDYFPVVIPSPLFTVFSFWNSSYSDVGFPELVL